MLNLEVLSRGSRFLLLEKPQKKYSCPGFASD